MRRTALLAVPIALALTGAYLVGTVHQPGVAAADTSSGSGSQGVIVSGLGKVSGTPDVLRLQVGVQVHRTDVSSALRDANTLQGRVRNALRHDGVDTKDLQTSEVSLSPSYDGKGHANGYDVSEQVTAKLRDLAKAGQTISDAVQAGGDAARLQGVSFALEDNAALLQQARDAAYGDAKAKAQRYADLSGRELGQVQLVSEQAPTGDQPVPRAMALDSLGTAGSAVPIDAGQSQVSVSVTVRWSLR